MRDDNELMLRVQRGDKVAFDEIVLSHRVSAVSFAYGFVKDIDISEDIVQDCFVKIYINRLDYKPLHTFKAYLFTLIRNKCIDYLRKNAVYQSVDIGSIEELSDGNSPEEIVIKKERTDKIFEILNGLRDNYKTALYLFAVEELSYKEIAGVMQKTVPQIKIIIFRARKKLEELGGADKDEN